MTQGAIDGGKGVSFTIRKLLGIFSVPAPRHVCKCTPVERFGGNGGQKPGGNPLVENCTFAKNTEFGVFIGSSDAGIPKEFCFGE